METLVTLNREQGVTIIVVTHEADIAAYADRVVTMRDGEIVSDERVAKPVQPAPAPVPASAEAPRSFARRRRGERPQSPPRASGPSV